MWGTFRPKKKARGQINPTTSKSLLKCVNDFRKITSGGRFQPVLNNPNFCLLSYEILDGFHTRALTIARQLTLDSLSGYDDLDTDFDQLLCARNASKTPWAQIEIFSPPLPIKLETQCITFILRSQIISNSGVPCLLRNRRFYLIFTKSVTYRRVFVA